MSYLSSALLCPNGKVIPWLSPCLIRNNKCWWLTNTTASLLAICLNIAAPLLVHTYNPDNSGLWRLNFSHEMSITWGSSKCLILLSRKWPTNEPAAVEVRIQTNKGPLSHSYEGQHVSPSPEGVIKKHSESLNTYYSKRNIVRNGGCVFKVRRGILRGIKNVSFCITNCKM